MAYVIAEPCIGTKDNSCVEVCPVDCIHPTPDEPGYDEVEMLYIDPEECIDCDACVEACPVDACFAEDQLPDEWTNYIQINAAYFTDPKGSCRALAPDARSARPRCERPLGCGGAFERRRARGRAGPVASTHWGRSAHSVRQSAGATLTSRSRAPAPGRVRKAAVEVGAVPPAPGARLGPVAGEADPCGARRSGGGGSGAACSRLNAFPLTSSLNRRDRAPVEGHPDGGHHLALDPQLPGSGRGGSRSSIQSRRRAGAGRSAAAVVDRRPGHRPGRDEPDPGGRRSSGDARRSERR